MRIVRVVFPLILAATWCVGLTHCLASDWPMWRHDAQRTAATEDSLASELHLQWVRELPALKPTWPDQASLVSDGTYEPIVLGQTVFIASSRNDRITAYDTRTGEENWRFYSEGPIRFAPVAWRESVYFASDDGHLYCLNAISGKLRWKFRGGPADRNVLGNERLISIWPARGAPVLAEGKIYFSASIWPFMGIFVHALDAETGEVVWTNDRTGSMYIKQPHNSPAFAGLSPQGYLAVAGDKLFVANGRAVPACLDRRTGKLLYFHHARHSRCGGYDVAAAGSVFFCGRNMFDTTTGKGVAKLQSIRPPVMSDGVLYAGGGQIEAYHGAPTLEETKDRRGRTQHELKLKRLWKADDTDGLEVFLKAGSRLYAGRKNEIHVVDLKKDGKPEDGSRLAKIEGTPSSMLAADGRLLVVSREGRVYCFGAESRAPVVHKEANPRVAANNGDARDLAEQILNHSQVKAGYCVVFGLEQDRLVDELVQHSELHVIAIDGAANRVSAARQDLDSRQLYGTRAAIRQADPLQIPLPPYLASLLVCTSAENYTSDDLATLARQAFGVLRPYGGAAYLRFSDAKHQAFSKAVEKASLAGAKVARAGQFTVLTREGKVPGAGDWTHQYGDASNTSVSSDKLVKAPLGLLWFGGPANTDLLPRHGHGPSQQVVGGRLIIEGPDMIRANDVYTGRLLWQKSLPGIGDAFKNTGHQPGANATGSNYVSVEDGVYVSYGDKLLRLNPDDGNVVSTFHPPKMEGVAEPKWSFVAVWEDLLVAGCHALAYEEKPIGSFTQDGASSKRIVVMDRHSGEVLWIRDAAFGFRHNAICLGGGKLFCIDMLPESVLEKMKRRGIPWKGEPKLTAVDARTGKDAWSTTENIFGTWLGYSAEFDILMQAGRPARDMLNGEPNDRLITYGGEDGTVRWDKPVRYVGPCMLHHDTIITQGGAVSLLTGETKMRTNSLTGMDSPWSFTRNYGCNSAVASECLLTFRSAAAGYFDLSGDSGTGNLGGFRSSCTSNLIVANGVLNAPDYTRTCSCGYQIQTSLALIHMPDIEMWTFNQMKLDAPKIERMGINFGAPGDRKADTGTLWLEYPASGGPSPAIPLFVQPANPPLFQRHSSAIQGDGPNWVAASGVRGIEQLTLRLNREKEPQSYTVRLHFSEPDSIASKERVFTVAIQGKEVLKDLDVVHEAGGPHRAIVREFKGIKVADDLQIQLTANSKAPIQEPVLSGLEVVAE